MINSRIILRFEEICLKQENTTPITPNNVINSFIAYELGSYHQIETLILL